MAHRDLSEANELSPPPRLGRRESEPHSSEVNYLWKVLQRNFPNDRVMRDTPHLFLLGNKEITLLPDISFFENLIIPEKIGSYDAIEYNNRKPILVINILTRRTWRKDFADNLEKCRRLKIPIYIVFFAYPIENGIYPYPFLRIYHLESDGEYKSMELTDPTFDGDELVNPEAILDCGEILPFRIGLMRLKEVFQTGEALYRMVLVKKDTVELFQTETEEMKKKWRESEERANAERKRADRLEAELKRLKKID